MTKISAKDLGQIVLIQSAIIGLPDLEKMYQFISRGLIDVSGIDSVYYQSYEVNETPPANKKTDDHVLMLPIERHNRKYADFFLTISDKDLFEEYKPFIENLFQMLSVIVEEHLQRKLNKQLINNLEELVKERTKELELSKQKAEESDQLKTTFLANLSHEIRTPMNGILGFAGLLKEDDIPENKQKRYLEVIEQSGLRMLDLINDLVDISKIESGQIQFNEQAFDLNQMQDALFQFFIPEARSKNLTLKHKNGLPPDKSQILTDKIKLEQVLTNLLKNALKFTKKGEISFGYRLNDNNLHFWVQDTGPGIDKKYHQTIFERFRQAENSPMREQEGSGLGLAISKAFVEYMNGKIWVESDGKQGSTFFFNIPYKASNISESPQIMENNFQLNENITILIAEDDETSYFYLEQILSDLNFRTIHAKTGKHAIELFKQNQHIKLILMDLKMPDMDGLEATQEIRKLSTNVPIVAQSAYAAINDKQQAIAAGCDAYLTKPIQKQILKDIILKFLNNK